MDATSTHDAILAFSPEEWTSLLNPQSAIALVLTLGFGAIWFLKDVKNPERTASHAILGDFVEHSAEVFDMANRAFAIATAAHDELQKVRESENRCERRNNALIRYNLTLTGQLTEAGIKPAPMPAELLE